MAGETTITVIGNLTSDPELRFTPSGSAVANFTIASTPRTFDRQSNEWKDGETLFLRASVWREAAENVAASLIKGSRVVATGRLKPRTYETKTGEKRTVIEFEIDEIGLSLRYAAAEAKGSLLKRASEDEPLVQDEAPAQDSPQHLGWQDRVKVLNDAAIHADHTGYADDDPRFGKNAAGMYSAQSARTAGPTF